MYKPNDDAVESKEGFTFSSKKKGEAKLTIGIDNDA